MTEFDRRALAKEISEIGHASVSEILKSEPASAAPHVSRIAFTGPPGAGKSTLISRWALRRVEKGRRAAVIAIDPTSPVSGGAILGDRVRMQALASHPRAFVRSVASGTAIDGLCLNVTGIMDAATRAGFDDIVLETVGVGQTTYAVRDVVDTMVLVLVPESGDTVQAMKAGVLELADVFVVHKTDLPGAERLMRDLREVIGARTSEAARWRPPIVAVSSLSDVGQDALDQAVADHQEWRASHVLQSEDARRRRQFQLRQLLAQQIEAALRETDDEHLYASSLGDAFKRVARQALHLA